MGGARPGVTVLRAGPARRSSCANTTLIAPPHVPEIRLHLADEAHDLWQRTEEELAEIGLPPPFWAFAWAGGQGLARYVLDHPELRARASACSISPPARASSPSRQRRPARRASWRPTSIRSAERRSRSTPRPTASRIDFTSGDMIGTDEGWDVVLAGDVFYDRALARPHRCPGLRGAWRRAARRCWSAIPAAPTCRSEPGGARRLRRCR